MRTGRTNAAPVIDQDGAAQGWCPHSSPEEAPDIKHRRICDQDAPLIPDWRTTCFQVGRKRHGQ